MKKILFIVISLIFTSLRITAATGWFNDYVKIDINGAGTTAPTGWYWIGGNPSYATQLDGANLGVITSLTITGCDMKYWGDGADRTGGSFFYKIMAADNTTQVVAPVETIWTQSYLGGNDFQGITSVSINLLTGLSWGTTYKVHVWAKSSGSSQGDSYLSNFSNDYVATFTTQPAPTAYNVTGTGSYCQGTMGLAVGVDDSETGVTYTISPGGQTQTGTGSAISFGTRTSGTYTVSGSNAGGTTGMTGSAVITENALPSAPADPGPISLCAGAFISVDVGTEETTDWYSASSLGTKLATGPANYFPSGLGTFYAEARNTTTACVSATRTAVTVTKFNAVPTAAISGGPVTICEGISTNLTFTLSGANPKNFTYFDGSTSTVVNSIHSNSAIISVSPTTDKTYTITSVGDANCGGTFSGSAVITVKPAATPTFTSAPAGTICANTDVTYTTESGQENYAWTYPGSTPGTDYSVSSGGTSTDNTVTLKWKTSGSKSVGVNYTPANGCAGVVPALSTVTVELPTATFTVKPGASTCANTDVTYTTQAGESSYAWTYPGSALSDYSITSGGGTGDNSVTLKWLTTGDKTVGVNYTTSSGCILTGDPVTTSVHVNVTPSAAGTIGGTASVTKGQNGVAYTVPAIANATSYIWAYTSGTGATIYGTGNSITIDFSASATSGNLTVKGLNDCGTGTVSANYSITVSSPTGPVAYAVTGTGSYCTSGGSGLAVGVANSETGVTYDLWKNGIATGTTQPGSAGSSITFGLQTAGTYTVKGTKDAQTTVMTGSAVITAVAPPTAFAGVSDFAMMGAPHLLSDATATNYTSVKWLLVSGNGSISNDAIVQPTFTGSISGQFVTLRLTATNGVCADATSTVQLVIIPAGVYSQTWLGKTSSWNVNSNWDPGPVPVQTDDVLIPATANNPIISSTAICKDLTIAAGAVTIASGGSLTVAGLLTNSVGAAGLVVKSGGSLIENTSGIAATVERTISTLGKWHYIAVPNNNTKSDKFTGDFLRSWAEPGAAWSYITLTTTKLNPVQGYSLWVKTSYGGPKTYSFADVLNTGDQQLTGMTYHNTGNPAGNDGANFLGNPYPSSIDWAGLQGTYGAVYYWDGTAYKSYINGSGAGSQFVPPMQGFFIVANASMISTTGGKFSLSNSNRVHRAPAFYKSGQAIKANSLVLATAGESYSDKLFVNFNPEATEGFDLQNDAFKLMANTVGISELYSFTGDTKLSVDVRPETQLIQLGFSNTLSGEYQIGIDQIADIPFVTLDDTKTGTFHDLLTGPYKFSYTAGESDKRFILLFGTTGLNETSKDAATVYSYQKTVYIHMAEQVKGDIYIYNIAGQQVASRLSAQGMNEIRLPNNGNFIVKIISKNSTVVRKVFIQK